MNESPQGARLLGRTGEFADITHYFAEEVTIGRSTGNDIVMDSQVLSGRHARIFFHGGEYWIEDLGSRNGTRVDGVTVTTPVTLHRVSVVTLADAFDFIFVRTFGRTSESPAVPGMHEPQPAPETPVHAASVPPFAPEVAPPAAGESTMFMTSADLDFAGLVDPRLVSQQAPPIFELVLALPDGGQQVFPLKPGANVLGRSEECDVPLPDPERWLSRRHATVTVADDGILVSDHGSVNGTFVNGERIETAPIEPGSSLRLGPEHDMKLIRR